MKDVIVVSTTFICDVCGKRFEPGAPGTLAQTSYRPLGEMVLRCAKHNTPAARQAAADLRALMPENLEWED